MSKSLHLAVPIILAIDFDNTISSSNSYPYIEGFKPLAPEYINQLAKDGYYIIIWTCRTGEALEIMQKFLDDNNIIYHKINEQHPALIELYKNDSRKIAADIYVDDKQLGGLPETWSCIYDLIKHHKRSIKTKILEYAIKHN